jgi:hypothetical protein
VIELMPLRRPRFSVGPVAVLAKITWLVIGETRTALMANRRYLQTHIN